MQWSSLLQWCAAGAACGLTFGVMSGAPPQTPPHRACRPTPGPQALASPSPELQPHSTLGRRVRRAAQSSVDAGSTCNSHSCSDPKQPLVEHGHGPGSCGGDLEAGSSWTARDGLSPTTTSSTGPNASKSPCPTVPPWRRVDWQRPQHRFGPPQNHPPRTRPHSAWQFRRGECGEWVLAGQP